MIYRRLSLHNSRLRLAFLVGMLAATQSGYAQNSADGKQLFEERCAACHHIGGGRLVGPDLVGVNDRRSESWLLSFIKSSQTVIKSGDAAAVALFNQFNFVMPDQALSDEQIKGILAYIKEAGSSASSSSQTATAVETADATPEQIRTGQDFFQGKVRLANGGPSCISCHSIHYGDVLSGGILAKDLTTAYSRLGAQGLQAIISNPPFPVMKAAFEEKSLTEQEATAMVGFLKHVDKENALHQPREYGWAMFGAGSVGVGILLGFYSLVGRRRKRGSVNQEIFDRQIKSV
jgi:mono/diheme cytochrome c family protein